MILPSALKLKYIIASNCSRVLYVSSNCQASIQAPATATGLHLRSLADFKVAALKEALYRGGIAPETLKA